jgi:hypothetical protein
MKMELARLENRDACACISVSAWDVVLSGRAISCYRTAILVSYRSDPTAAYSRSRPAYYILPSSIGEQPEIDLGVPQKATVLNFDH